jgi:hypothetical protein
MRLRYASIRGITKSIQQSLGGYIRVSARKSLVLRCCRSVAKRDQDEVEGILQNWKL